MRRYGFLLILMALPLCLAAGCGGGGSGGERLKGGASVDVQATPPAVPPVIVAPRSGLTPIISAGSYYNCAVIPAGEAVKCWGANDRGQLGNASSTASARPVLAQGLSNIMGVTSGFNFSCALSFKGKVWCWGDNAYGELGAGISDATSSIPVAVPSLSNVKAISAGGNHACALAEDGTVKCWGDNQFGQLGIGTFINSNVPAAVSFYSKFTMLASGAYQTCATIPDSSQGYDNVYCWGMVGNGGVTNNPLFYTLVGALNSISAGGLNMCVLQTSGTAKCWGGLWRDNDGLAGGVYDLWYMGTMSQIAVSKDNVCGLSYGVLGCMGDNTEGQIGNGTTSYDWGMAPVTGITNAVEVTSGIAHACAYLTDGSIKCWGRDDEKQLGNGSTADSSVPVTVQF